MRNRNQKGFTIIGILAAVLIPNLLSARARAFDTAAQTCLRTLATEAEVAASIDPFDYATAPETGDDVDGCDANVTWSGGSVDDDDGFLYTAKHAQSERDWFIEDGAGVLAGTGD